MPTSHSSSMSARLTELAQAYQITPNDGYVTIDTWFGDAPDPRPSAAVRLRRSVAFEKEQLKLFMADGLPHELTLWQQSDGALRVLGHDIKDENIMFLLDSEKVTVQNKRSKHLIPLLTKLAEREGLALDEVDEYPPGGEGGAKIAFCKLNVKEVDDKALLDKLVTRLPQDIPQMVYDEAYMRRPELVYGSAIFDRGEVVLSEEMPF